MKKSDLLLLLGGKMSAEPLQIFDCKVVDGAAVVHMLPTKLASTFFEYANKVFLSWMKQQLTKISKHSCGFIVFL